MAMENPHLNNGKSSANGQTWGAKNTYQNGKVTCGPLHGKEISHWNDHTKAD